jgi:hypothetical protein
VNGQTQQQGELHLLEEKEKLCGEERVGALSLYYCTLCKRFSKKNKEGVRQHSQHVRAPLSFRPSFSSFCSQILHEHGLLLLKNASVRLDAQLVVVQYAHLIGFASNGGRQCRLRVP